MSNTGSAAWAKAARAGALSGWKGEIAEQRRLAVDVGCSGRGGREKGGEEGALGREG